MAIFKREKNWWIEYYVRQPATGKLKRKREKVGLNRRLAQRLLSQRLSEISAHSAQSPATSVKEITFFSFAKLFLDTVSRKKKSAFRDEVCVKHFKKFFGDMPLMSITPLEVEQYHSARLQMVGKSTVNKEIKCLRQLFKKAILWGYATINPVQDVRIYKEPRRLRYISEEEFASLVERAADHLKPIIIVAWHTGLRRGNILNLQWHQVHFQTGCISITETKSESRLDIPMNDVVFNALKEIRRKNLSSHYVFCNNQGKPYGNIKTAFKAACRKAGVKDFRFHDLRHCFASHLVMKGASLNDVRELLGHKSIKMTLRYAHLSPQHKKDVVALLSSHGHQSRAAREHAMDTKGKLG